MEKIKGTATSAEDIKEQGLDAGVSENKHRDSNNYSLPENGKFTGWEIHKNDIDGQSVSYYVLTGEDDAGNPFEYPVSSIQRMLLISDRKPAQSLIVPIGGDSDYKDYYKLQGAKPVNPQFMGDQSKIIEKLLGKSFKSDEITNGWVCKFSDSEKEIQPKGGYYVKLKAA